VTVHCYVEPERQRKTKIVMRAMAAGCGGIIVNGYLEPRGEGVFWGHRWFAERHIPVMIAEGRRWYLVDNGYFNPSAGVPQRSTMRVTIDGLAPRMIAAPFDRAEAQGVTIRPWRPDGGHIVVCHPGPHFGRPLGLDMEAWSASIVDRLNAHTDRHIIERHKGILRPLAADLRGAWAVVTHSSTAAVVAACEGFPVFVEPTAAAAPVGNLDLARIEYPDLPEGRREWAASLAYQQFTLDEMTSGFAWRMLKEIDNGERAL